MKKKIKIMLCVILAAVLCMGTPSSVMAASEKYNAAVTKYQNFLAKNQGYYEIVDVDQNGVPELLYQNYMYSRIYTYDASTKKMKKLAQVNMGRFVYKVGYSKKTKTVFLPSDTTHDFSRTIYKIKGRKAKKVLTSYYGAKYASRSKEVYKINGKKVSKSKYNKKLKKYMKKVKYIEQSNW